MRTTWKIGTVLVIFIIASSLVYYAWAEWPNTLDSHVPVDKQGVFGDSYGALNTLFTGLALTAVALSFVLQIIESSARSKREHIDQFESRLFFLLKQCSEHRQTLDVRNANTGAELDRGKDCFRRLLSLLSRASTLSANKTPDPLTRDTNAYQAIYLKFQDDLGTHFRLLYHTMRFLDRANGVENKIEYSDMIRAGLSDSEVRLLAFNGLSEPGAKFKPLIEKYHLLKHSGTEFRQSYAHIVAKYDKSAFEDPK